ncbi:NAD(P)/FAD-dependent oxidoreductase [Nocardioides sp. L-11A]|uniref:flavin-containing monooxygenase n=1 Tax=Nocardioides sp. L-11A TaxID=3043848 RepID=UPI00249A2422|nr:NAD(P)/FAD-dependent oxidoreductase [Nocardioides sp. L-11A]
MANLRRVDVVIVGAGMAGLYSAFLLRAKGLSVRVLEAGSGVGGTWFWNRYPGARCDIDSVDYSYSFSSELENEWDWKERYASQPELEAYFNHVADRFELRELIDFDTQVRSAVFDEAEHEWTVGTGDDTYRARFVVMATGPLSQPYRPDLPGLDDFVGRVLHSAQWPEEPVDFTGRRVGIIGTGSTGIQMIPLIARQAEHLHVFQRTPNYSVPARNCAMTSEQLAQVRATYRERRRLARESKAGFPPRTPEISARSALEVTEEQRREVYELMWEQGGGLAFRAAFADLSTSEDANETAAEFIRDKIRQTVTRPEVAELLVPHDHPYAAKRPPVDIEYYETFNRDDVSLIDVRADPIEAITADGLRTRDRHFTFDDLVLATGFDAVTGALSRIDIRGVRGETLQDAWADGPRTLLGMATAGFPNLFLVNGPGSPAAFTNIALHTEVNVEWLAGLIESATSAGSTWVEPRREAVDGWAETVREAADATLYPRAESWYLGANIPGKPRVFMFYVGGLDRFSALLRQEAAGGYPQFALRGHDRQEESA